MVRRWFFGISALTLLLVALTAIAWPPVLWSLVVLLPLVVRGLYDAFQSHHTVLRNFPLIGHGRYMMEIVRPEVQQYFIENNIDAFPIEREYRSIVYQRAKGDLETRPYGTQRDVYRIGYEWAGHAIAARERPEEAPRIDIGGPDCTQPYSASLLNVSAMSFGSISKNAVLALSKAAKAGNFAHNTGEGGISRYHLEGGGDLIWEIGTAYFGCRTREGKFDPEQFQREARRETVRMIEVKLSQGAKPGHGSILPAVKVNREIAESRGVPEGETVISPPAHSAFDTPMEFMEFLSDLRRRSGGKPVGFKLCIGRRTDFLAICKAMLETGIAPDFITIDGGEGGTAAAPLEFSNSMGMPARDGWIFAHNALCGVNVRDQVRLMVCGKILTGFHMLRALALGADVCLSARGMMLALGCIQSLRCNTNRCPTGITTHDPRLVYGLQVPTKTERVRRFHRETIHGCQDLIAAMGLSHPDELRPEHIFRRIDDLRVRNLAELYDFLEPGQLLRAKDVPEGISREWRSCRPDRWSLTPETGQYGGQSKRA